MWLAKQGNKEKKRETAADIGTVTIGGNDVSVYLDGERRSLPVFSPGGYEWRPKTGDSLLVLKTGGEREKPCVAGRAVETEIAAGEVLIASDGGVSLYLQNSGGAKLTGNTTVNGTLSVTGTLMVGGTELTELIEKTVAKLLGG